MRLENEIKFRKALSLIEIDLEADNINHSEEVEEYLSGYTKKLPQPDALTVNGHYSTISFDKELRDLYENMKNEVLNYAINESSKTWKFELKELINDYRSIQKNISIHKNENDNKIFIHADTKCYNYELENNVPTKKSRLPNPQIKNAASTYVEMQLFYIKIAIEFLSEVPSAAHILIMEEIKEQGTTSNKDDIQLIWTGNINVLVELLRDLSREHLNKGNRFLKASPTLINKFIQRHFILESGKEIKLSTIEKINTSRYQKKRPPENKKIHLHIQPSE